MPWWFRTFFRGCADPARRTWLHFDGINFQADVWLNGHLVASRRRVAGTFRTFRFDVTDGVRPGRNVVAVEVLPVSFKNDLTLTWIDWNPKPPDRGMGIWREAYLTTSGRVTLDSPNVQSGARASGMGQARLTVSADAENSGSRPVDVVVRGSIGAIRFVQTVRLGPGERRLIEFDARRLSSARRPASAVWWPAGMGAQPMNRLRLQAIVDGHVSDDAGTAFGIRTVGTDFLSNGARRWLINGKPILIRGGGWAPDIFLREQPGACGHSCATSSTLG